MERQSTVTSPTSDWISCSFGDEFDILYFNECTTIDRELIRTRPNQEDKYWECKVHGGAAYKTWISAETCNMNACVTACLEKRFFSFLVKP